MDIVLFRGGVKTVRMGFFHVSHDSRQSVILLLMVEYALEAALKGGVSDPFF